MNKKRFYKEPFILAGILFSVIAVLLTGQIIFESFKALQTDASQQIMPELVEEEKDYELAEDATPYQKQLFEQLEPALLATNDVTNLTLETQYACLVVQNFVADFYTWSNKMARSDVGGLQFVYSTYRDELNQKAIDTYYLYLDHYIQTNHPLMTLEIEQVNILDAQKLDYTLADESIVTVFEIEADWTYTDNTPLLETDIKTRAKFILAKQSDKWAIISIEEGGEIIE